MQVAAELEVVGGAGPEERRGERAMLNVAAGVRPQSSTTIQATILDLSRFGFRARLSAPAPVGTVVWLNLPGMAGQQACVVWADGLMAGCALTAPLHPAVFTHIVSTLARHD